MEWAGEETHVQVHLIEDPIEEVSVALSDLDVADVRGVDFRGADISARSSGSLPMSANGWSMHSLRTTVTCGTRSTSSTTDGRQACRIGPTSPVTGCHFLSSASGRGRISVTHPVVQRVRSY